MRLRTVIYEARLFDGRRYIGQTARGLDVRKAQHLKQARYEKDGHYNTRFATALREYGHDAFAWRVLCVVEEKELPTVERALIARFGLDGPNGFNGNAGGNVGNRGRKASEETRAKIRAARARQVFDPEVYKRRSLRLRGKKRPEKVMRALQAGYQRWRKENPEAALAAVEKASRAKRGKKPWNFGLKIGSPSEVSNKKRRAALAGRPLSPEHRERIGASNRGKKRTDEQRERMSAAKRGRPGRKLTPEQLANLIEAQHRWRREHPDEAAEKAKRHSEAMRQKFAARKAA